MNISQNISDLEGNVDVGGNPTPVFGNRTVTSYVTLHDGDVLVLGGMRQRKVNNTHGVLFLLGEIPIVGQLFQPDETDTTTSELLIFIKPTIIKSTANIDGMMSEIAKNSEANDIAQRYIRNPDLESAGVVIQEKDSKLGAKADAAHQSAPTPAPAPNATLMPAASSSATEPPAPAAPAPAAASPTPPPSSPPAEGSTQPNPVIQGFNK
jgi:general secretion pathway protein D